MNILSTLIPNATKVKEILKEQSLDLDAVENTYLFGEKFEEKLSKITSAKQKSKNIFTGLQKSPTPRFSGNPQPFRSGPPPQLNHQGTGGRGQGASLFQRAAVRRGKSSSSITSKSGNTIPRKVFSNSSSHL